MYWAHWFSIVDLDYKIKFDNYLLLTVYLIIKMQDLLFLFTLCVVLYFGYNCCGNSNKLSDGYETDGIISRKKRRRRSTTPPKKRKR